ncbi:MAG: hypothetical protein OER56_10585 [Hyphomicrobiales bacterium]|nr:hypothetical protein [Hyphomicrobiales bacterium]
MAALRVGHTEWSLNDGTITKSCSYAGLLGDDKQHTLLIEITTTRSHHTGLLEPHVRLVLDPDPLQGVEEVSLQGQLEILSTPYDPPSVPVTVDHLENALEISVASTRDSESFVETISSGENVQFVLRNGNESLIQLPIPSNAGVIKILREALD